MPRADLGLLAQMEELSSVKLPSFKDYLNKGGATPFALPCVPRRARGPAAERRSHGLSVAAHMGYPLRRWEGRAVSE